MLSSLTRKINYKSVIYICSEIAATYTFVMQDSHTHFEMHLINILIVSDFARLAI